MKDLKKDLLVMSNSLTIGEKFESLNLAREVNILRL